MRFAGQPKPNHKGRGPTLGEMRCLCRVGRLLPQAFFSELGVVLRLTTYKPAQPFGKEVRGDELAPQVAGMGAPTLGDSEPGAPAGHRSFRTQRSRWSLVGWAWLTMRGRKRLGRPSLSESGSLPEVTIPGGWRQDSIGRNGLRTTAERNSLGWRRGRPSGYQVELYWTDRSRREVEGSVPSPAGGAMFGDSALGTDS